jgi:hypothetical protein
VGCAKSSSDRQPFWQSDAVSVPELNYEIDFSLHKAHEQTCQSGQRLVVLWQDEALGRRMAGPGELGSF